MTTGYTSASDVLADRVRWTKACLTELVRRGRLEGWVAGEATNAAGDPWAVRAEIEARLAVTETAAQPMAGLAARLGLTASEADALWLLVCCELDPGAARLAASVAAADNTDVTVLAWQGMVSAGGGALTAAAIDRLARAGLVETTFDPRLPPSRRWVRANDRVSRHARGEIGLDRELADVAMLAPADQLAARRARLPEGLSAAIARDPAPLIIVHGGKGSGRATMLAALAGMQGAGTLQVRASGLAADDATLIRQLRAIARESCLFGALPLLMDADALVERRLAVVDQALLSAFGGPVLVTTTLEHQIAVERPTVSHRVVLPATEERARQWRAALPDADRELIETAAERYRVSAGMIAATANNARARAGAGSVTAVDLHDGLRTLLDQRLSSLATRIECRQRWDDLVLPRDQFEQLVELVARARHRGQVLETWGFGAKVGKGGGVAALLSGPPGTGKTMAAGLVARELGLDLYQIDLSKIVSKYIGETEKQLSTVFDAAEAGHAILLFDEADALFARRTDVKSSNDRNANLEVNYLLQRMESFTGICILTTNHDAAIDPAFRRRLSIHVRFPVPDEAERAELWRVMLPAQAAVAGDVDPARLGCDFEMSGGYIKNAAVRAAYLAADEGAAISMQHLVRGARAEYEAIGKVAYHAVTQSKAG